MVSMIMRVTREYSLNFKAIRELLGPYSHLSLRWLETVSSTLMGRYSHYFSLDAAIMVPKNCPIIGEHVVTIFVIQ